MEIFLFIELILCTVPFMIVNAWNGQFVSIYAAYLYDSAKLYAWALDELLRNASKTQTLTHEEVYNIARDGSKIIETIIKNGTYKSKISLTVQFIGLKINSFLFLFFCQKNKKGVTGSTIKIDSNGDSEGNFSVLAFKPFKYSYRENLSCNYHMVPVAYFQQGSDIPVSESSFFVLVLLLHIFLPFMYIIYTQAFTFKLQLFECFLYE